jgi:hypothetical protein
MPAAQPWPRAEIRAPPARFRPSASAGVKLRGAPAADETRARRPDVDARLVRESKQESGASGAFPVTEPDHPDFLRGLDYVMPNPGRQRYR